jgi:hypothetical protein
MIDIDLVATFQAIAALVTSLGVLITVILTFLNRRAAGHAREAAQAARKAAEIAAQAAEDARKEIIGVSEKGVIVLGKQLDGRLTQLIEETKKLARLEGIAEGEQRQRDRAAAADGSGAHVEPV